MRSMEKYSPGDDSAVMTREQVRAIDSWAINTLGIPGGADGKCRAELCRVNRR